MRQLPLHGICRADKLCGPAQWPRALNANDAPLYQHNGHAKRNDTLIKIIE
jgi:hypothetical protein